MRNQLKSTFLDTDPVLRLIKTLKWCWFLNVTITSAMYVKNGINFLSTTFFTEHKTNNCFVLEDRLILRINFIISATLRPHSNFEITSSITFDFSVVISLSISMFVFACVNDVSTFLGKWQIAVLPSNFSISFDDIGSYVVWSGMNIFFSNEISVYWIE